MQVKKMIKAVVLAAGKSTRMKSAYSKMSHRILGKEIINYLIDSLIEVGIKEDQIIIVAGQNKKELQGIIPRKVTYVGQKEQLGTAHAFLCAREYIKDYKGDLLVTVGDNPYINAFELKRLIEQHRQKGSPCTFISAVFPSTPPPYGRVIRDLNNEIQDVVEEINATPENLKIREVNSSIYLFDNKIVYPLVAKINNQNPKGEYYLVDVIKLLKKRGYSIQASIAQDHMISVGINNRWELQQAQNRFNQKRLQLLAMENGVTITQPGSITVEYDVVIGIDTVIYPSTYIGNGTRIGKNCHIGPFVYLRGVDIKDGEQISFEKRIKD